MEHVCFACNSMPQSFAVGVSCCLAGRPYQVGNKKSELFERMVSMKAIEKIMVAALALVMALALAACGGSSSSSSAADSSASSADTASSAASDSAATETESTEAADEDAEAADAEAIEGDKYENEYFGIAFFLPDGWSFVNEDALDGLVTAAVEESGQLEMAAEPEDKSVTVLVEVVPANEETSGMTAEEFLQEKSDESLELAGDGNVSYTTETATITFDGSDMELPAVVANYSFNGAEMSSCHIAEEKEGNILDIYVIGPTEEEVNAAVSNFKAIL